jgi:serine/threonine-protein phosphatase 2A regulatory subunit A
MEGTSDEISELDVYPMAVLIEELKSKDIKRRINSVKNLDTIAIALGPEKTRIELLPFINGKCNLKLDLLDDEEEVLILLAETLGNFIDHVGGPSYSMSLIRPLEQLTIVEENSVRDKVIFLYTVKAIESIKKVLRFTDVEESEGEVIGIIKRLTADKWYTTKIAAVTLIPFIFPQVTSRSQEELISY